MKIAVVGASGIVGQEVIKILSRCNVQVFPVGNRSAQTWVSVGDTQQSIEHIDNFDFTQMDGVIISAGSECAKEIQPRVGKAWMIDNSTAFRQDPNVSLVVPELFQGEPTSVVASPNCIAIPVSLVLAPILELSAIDSIWGSTYQSVSGAGRQSMQQLAQKQGVYNDVHSGIGEIDTTGISEEEAKITQEVQKILSIDSSVNIMSVRVPITYGHSVHLSVRLIEKHCLKTILEKLEQCPYIKLYQSSVPTPKQVVGSHQVHVGRVKQVGQSLDLWLVADNVYRGAAWNVCQIAKQYFGLKEVMTND